MTTLAEINRKIAKLQKQAEVLKARDRKGVIDRIRVAIAHFDITSHELGLATGARRGPKPGRDSAQPNSAQPIDAQSSGARRGNGLAIRAMRKRQSGAPASAPRYRDAQGNTWSGRGKRPNWFKTELAAGRTLESLLVRDAEGNG